jgi:predicted transcriptional regulator
MNEDLRYLEAFIKDKPQIKHPTDKLLANFIDKKLIGTENEVVMLHLIECYECREIIININKYGISSKAINIKRWSPVLLVSASLLLFIFLPFKEEALLGMMDLSKVETTNYQSVVNSTHEKEIIDADNVLKEIIASTSLGFIESFNQALIAEEENRLEEAKALYKQSFIQILRNINTMQRLKQKITLHHKLLKISIEQKNKSAYREYRSILRNEIRTYLLLHKKGK